MGRLRISLKFMAASILVAVAFLGIAKILAPWPAHPVVIGLATFLLGAAVALLVGMGFSHHLTRPFHRMLDAGTGALDRKVKSVSRDELADLALFFSGRIQELEDRVRSLSEGHHRLSAVLSGMREGVMVLDRRGTILMVNKALQRMFRLRDQKVVGRSSLEILRHYGLIELIRRVLESGKSQSMELMIETDQERFFHVQASVTADRRDRDLSAVLVFHDITELKRLERVRKDFVANASHELRTPLAAMKGYIEALIDGEKDDSARSAEFLEILRNNTDRLNNIIDDLLTLTQIESGRYVWKRDSLKIVELLERVMATLKPAVQKRGHVVSVRLPESLPDVPGDPEKLTQVFTNLVDNAIKYTSDGGKITIEGHQVSGGVEFMISDTGPGISRKDQLRIFERFYRVDRARSRDLGGTGLGLSIVKHIVEAHGGEVRVESTLGKGSTFTISLPAEPAPPR